MELPTELTALYGPTFGRYVTNITVTPDFDLSARLASAWWQTLAQPAPDAIVSIDPIVLRALLRITGPAGHAVAAPLLFAVERAPARTVLLAKVDPVAARDLFIRHALGEGDWTTHHRFFHANRELLAEATELEHRTRTRGLVVDDETPEGVRDAVSIDQVGGTAVVTVEDAAIDEVADVLHGRLRLGDH